MKENCMSQTEEEIKLQIKPRSTEPVLLKVPVDAMRSLEQVATSRDMSIDALLKFYIGKGLRQDMAELFGDRLLKTRYSIGNTTSILQQNTQVILRLSAVGVNFDRALIMRSSFG